MIAKWMRLARKVRPWMVAVSMAVGAGAAGLAASSCDSGECEGASFYGPATCTTDEQCVERSGPGWYCDPEPLVVDDGCGNEVSWGRICVFGGTGDGGTDGDADATDTAPDEATGDATDVVDVMPDTAYGPPDVVADDSTGTYYGPATDVTEDDLGANLYGPLPADVGTDAEVDEDASASFYGPLPP
jgi:hypothetical protein